MSIKQRKLAEKIESLAKNSHITRTQADLLHGIRFMGNDAAHDLAKPETKSLQLVLEITEHLVDSIYVLKGKAKGTVETAISDYGVFENTLFECIQDQYYGWSIENDLRGWLGQKYRLFEPAIQMLEKELIENINAGTLKELKLGKVGGKNENIQFYIKE